MASNHHLPDKPPEKEQLANPINDRPEETEVFFGIFKAGTFFQLMRLQKALTLWLQHRRQAAWIKIQQTRNGFIPKDENCKTYVITTKDIQSVQVQKIRFINSSIGEEGFYRLT